VKNQNLYFLHANGISPGIVTVRNHRKERQGRKEETEMVFVIVSKAGMKRPATNL
jgi:hypothetical protein